MAELIIKEFPLSDFDELTPLLLRCFPDFWTPRLERGMKSFPYDLTLFCASVNGQMIGTVGVHEYTFLLDGETVSCGGLCDVGVDPDFRGRGYARRLQQFALQFCRAQYADCPMMPLYTDKPGVYLSMGWQLYEPDRGREIRTEDFSAHETFRLNLSALHPEYLSGKQEAATPEEKIFGRIRDIYRQGGSFNGKCRRSVKTWLELFAEPEHEWALDGNTYFLYRKEQLLEAFSADPEHPVRQFVPVQGGHNDNKLMLNLPQIQTDRMIRATAEVKQGTLLFPIADTF